jgi:ABC-type polysaccharide/polyol phosphate transport system ATPase subunit
VNAIEVNALEKRFRIPSVHRATVREHLFGMFQRRRFETLDVLRGISFSVKKGEALGIMGRNGCGKSTLLKIIAGIYRPDAGRVEVHGPLTPILNLGLGWDSELTAFDNLLLTGTAMGMSMRDVEEQFHAIVAFAELERFMDLQLKFYSAGMGARLAYSIAFSAVRDILLLDEIFSVGDAAFMRRCEERFVELHKAGHTLVLVSHDPSAIERFCQRAVLLEGGRIVLDSDSAAVAHEYRRLLLHEE